MAETVQPAPVSGAFKPTSPLPKQQVNQNENLFSSQTFLDLLGKQMSNQNPLDPKSDTEFIAQMAQFSSLEQLTDLNKTMGSLGIGLALTQGSAMVGKTVTYMPQGGTQPVTGVVDRVLVNNGGKDLSFVVGGVNINPNQVLEVKGS